MKRLSLALCVVAMAFAATPASASYSIYKWPVAGDCGIWNNAFPGKPFGPAKLVAWKIRSFESALRWKSKLVKRGVCRF